MQLRFIHAADIHLGFEQYNLTARANDFVRAYLALAEYAIAAQADFVVIAGDLFHKANADAWTLRQAMYGLEMLREARIPVIAIEGNHDTQHYVKNLSWMQFLCDMELLSLLNVERAQNGLYTTTPFDESRRGTWIDVAGARIYGVKYHGAATHRILEQIAGDIEPGPNGYTIMMLHAGMEGQVPHLHGGLTRGQVEPLRSSIDYLALGHVHKRLQEDDWIFNPSSTEINSFEEIEWPHGFFDVQVDTSRFPKHEVTAIETPTLRPFRRIVVSADGARSLDEYVARVEERLAETRNIPEKAVVELYLGGIADFRRQDVPIEGLKAAVELSFAPLTVRVKNNLVPPGTVHVSNRERLSRAELERQVIEHLVYQNAEYRDSAGAWARLILDVKNMAMEKDLPANIVDHIRSFLHDGREAGAEADEAGVLASVPVGRAADGGDTDEAGRES